MKYLLLCPVEQMLWHFGLCSGKVHFSLEETLHWWQLCLAYSQSDGDIHLANWSQQFHQVIFNWCMAWLILGQWVILSCHHSLYYLIHRFFWWWCTVMLSLTSYGGYTSPLICPKSASWHPYLPTHPYLTLLVVMPGMTVFLLGTYGSLFCCYDIYLCSCILHLLYCWNIWNLLLLLLLHSHCNWGPLQLYH